MRTMEDEDFKKEKKG